MSILKKANLNMTMSDGKVTVDLSLSPDISTESTCMRDAVISDALHG